MEIRGLPWRPSADATASRSKAMRNGMMIVTGILCIGLSLATAQESTATKLVGTWVAAKGSLPPNSTLTFSKDGKIVLEIAVPGKEIKMAGTYTVKDNAISSRLTFEGKEMAEVHKIKRLTETELHTEDEKGMIDEFKKK
jgi:uncharacterized protein (TIGR03066 family)